MAVTLTSLTDLASLGFDAVIDVRSPAEFAEDHMPGAISLPVLDDAERARVGTIYKQESPFKARKIGAALVAKNAARHIEGPLADMDGGWRPLVYCWRGGQRSGSFATILGQIGWRAETVAGGYKSWRALVVKALYETPFPAPVVVLDGNTGTAKTALLHQLRARGVQVIDLEGLANHRGSLFGQMVGGQPAQKGFETALVQEIAALDPTRPVVVEAESSKVGDLRLPPKLWRAMCDAPRIHVAAPLEARAAFLARAYADLTADREALHRVIDKLRPMQPAESIEHWHGLADTGRFQTLAAELMRQHYDPRYDKQRARTAGDQARTVTTEDLGEAALPGLAARIEALIQCSR
ncbi:tRNA 2-selenouridine synthase [Defluviimonas sp. 20V17]|uniref:tRNA 2-selenouridine synthase n=1 Tax=Allgaiera indica TaxID=765699 RepID=A0AAN4UNC7_9RHOB|nr:tRNA 2-selenouridine(34) synthase MnmH [Allgaiera indica]KDB02204.1 tRNA 2-selenouridine synthase [Defluviimonas sp. 20V17]GHD98845.1 tRNA 2-selenouridine synthase [Allgaiera indica]SDW04927.1 tRNA 2-selenouridine synthase [Allgaiera indica]